MASNPILDQARKDAVTTQVQTAIPASTETIEDLSPVAGTSKLEAVQQALQESTGRITTNIQQLEASVKQTQTATDVAATAIADIAAANQIVQTTKDTVDLQAQNATIDSFEVSGGVEMQTALAATLKEDSERVATLLDEKQDIVDDEFTGIQVVDAVINEFRSIQTSLEIEAAQAQQQQTITSIRNSTTATESFARQNALTKRTLNSAVIEANYKGIEADSKLKGAKVELDNINSNATAMARLVSADSQNVSNLVSAFRLEGEAEARELAKERQTFAREQMAFTREQWAVQLPAAKVALDQAKFNLGKSQTLGPTVIASAEQSLATAQKNFSDQVATGQQISEAVQQGQALVGLPIEPRETIEFGMSNPVTREKYTRLQELGGVPDMRIGQTAFEAKSTLDLIAPQGGLAETPATKALDTITSLQIEVYNQSPEGIPKDDAIVEEDFNNTANTFMANAASKIVTGDTSNPYHAPPMGTLANAMKSIRDSKFYKTVLAPMEMKEINPEKIVEAAVAGVRAGTVSPDEASLGIETIFDSAAAYNNTLQGGYRRLGLPNQASYNVQFKRPPRTAAETLDLALIPFRSKVSATLLGTLIGVKGAKDIGTTALQILRSPHITVNLMDATQIKSTLVKFLSVAPDKADTTPPVDTNSPGTEQ
jgi:hypothetical protein